MTGLIPDIEYVFNVWGPTGQTPRIIAATDSTLDDSGLRAQVTPEGETREVAMNYRGKPRQPLIGIESLAAVQFAMRYRPSFDLIPIWYAQVRQGGNQQNVDGENVVLRSLSLRLGEVPLSPGFSTPQQAAHLTVQALIQNVLPSLDGLILYDPALIPDLGFDAAPITNGNEQNPLAFLTALQQQGQASTPPVDIRFGVNPERYFFCRLAKQDVLTLMDVDVQQAVWKEPVAEKPCTLVKWFVARRADNTWITYDSLSPLRDEIGLFYKGLTTGTEINPWALVPGTYQFFAPATGGSPAGTVESGPSSNYPGYSDGKTDAIYGSGGASAAYVVQFTPNAGQTWQRATIAGSAMHGGAASITLLGVKPAANTILFNTPTDQKALGWMSRTVYPVRGAAYVQAPFIATALADADNLANVQVAELRVERINTELLDSLARSHFSGPASDPADLTLRQVLSPSDFKGRVQFGDYGRAIEVYELRISADGGLEQAVLTGQADDPAVLARNTLIKANDNAAVIQSITAQR